jgi:hypothetical protein
MKMTNRRMSVVLAVLGAGIGASVTMAVQATAGPTAPPSPPPPLRPPATAGIRADAAPATNAHCGQTITASLFLNGDLYCSGGTALTVAGAGVVVNLNGHLIGGDGTGIGIQVTGRSDSVQNGLLTEFNEGLDVTGANDTVSTVRATYNNGPGFFDEGRGTKLTNDFVAFSASDGVVSVGADGVYTGVHAVNSGNNGMILEGSDASVTAMIANGNDDNGIDDLGYGTTLTRNVADFNGNAGIYSRDASLVDGGGNSAKANERSQDPSAAVECLGVVCS